MPCTAVVNRATERKRLKPTVWILSALCAWSFATENGFATSHLVFPDGSGEFPTIQDAVDAAEEGDTILLADEVFPGEPHPGITLWGKTW